MVMSPKIVKQIQHLPADTRKRIQHALSSYPSADKKKLWFMGEGVRRVRCGKYRIIVREQEHTEPEVIYVGLRNDVYRRIPTLK